MMTSLFQNYLENKFDIFVRQFFVCSRPIYLQLEMYSQNTAQHNPAWKETRFSVIKNSVFAVLKGSAPCKRYILEVIAQSKPDKPTLVKTLLEIVQHRDFWKYYFPNILTTNM